MVSIGTSRTRRVLSGLIGSVALAALLPLATAAPASAATASLCSSPAHPALAAQLNRDIRSALAGRSDSVGISVWDARTGTYCGYNSHQHYDSASAVKATIMAVVLRRAQEQHRGLTSWESSNLRLMITQSDNNAASNLWTSVGRTRFSAYLRYAGMTSTVPGPGNYWGLTQLTARDEVRLLDTFTDNHTVLISYWRAYALRLMSQVTPSQRWGAPYGAPHGPLVSNKNGWLPRATRGWRVNTIGAITGSGRDYRMAILSDNNRTMSYGVDTLDRIALVVNRDLGGAGASSRSAMVAPSAGAYTGPQASDGSAPFGAVK